MLDPYGAEMDVRLIRWPAAKAQLDELRAAGVPRLVVVDGDAAPPVPPDELEDWVRLPADQSDVRIRVDTLAGRARGKAVPQLSPEGVLRHAGLSVVLSPVEHRLVDALIARFGVVVSRHDLMDVVWPDERPPRNTLDVHISRLRRRLGELDLGVTTVRGRGYLLDSLSARSQQVAANE